jgi:hypothetical protein
MARQGALAALVLVLAACSTSSPAAKGGGKTATGQLEVAVEVDAAGASPRVGELATVIFRIHNTTPNSIILRDLTLPRDLMLTGSTSSVVTWQFSPKGLVSYAAERDEWTYDKNRRPDIPRPVFNSGLVVPDERLVVRARVRLLEMPMDFQFSYFELTAEEVRRKVYFEFREQKLLRYRTLLGQELQNRLIPSLRSEEDGHRIIVFPHAEPVASNALLRTFRLQQPLRPRFFTLDQAAQKAGVARPRTGDYPFSSVYDAWVIPKDKGHVLVTPTAVTPLPELRQMDRTFHLLDSAVPDRVTIELRSHSAASALSDLKYPLVKDEKEIPVGREVKEKRVTYYLFLNSDACARLLADLAKLKLVLDVEYGEGGGRLLVLNK